MRKEVSEISVKIRVRERREEEEVLEAPEQRFTCGADALAACGELHTRARA